MRIIPLDEGSRKNILEDLLKRDPNQYSQYADTVSAIVERVKKDKDEALFSYTLQFDKAEISAENVRVSQAEIEEAREKVDPKLLAVMEKSMENIREYHQETFQSHQLLCMKAKSTLGS